MEKINSFSLSTILVALSGAPFWGILSSYLVHTSKTNIIISITIGYILSIILSKIILRFFETEEDLSISNKFKLIFKKFSIVINIIFILLSFAIFVFLLFRLATFLNSQYLLLTPKAYLYFLILSVTMYISSKGIETLSRLSIISFIIAILTFILDVFSLLKHINLDNFLPLMICGTKSTIIASLIFCVYFTVPTLYINVIKKNQLSDKKKFNKYFYLSTFISFIILLLVISITLGVFGFELASIFDYPLYTVLKRIEILTFIESIENISISIWILYIIISTSTIMLTIINSVKDTFNIKNQKYIILVFFLLAYITPLLTFKSESITNGYDFIYIPFITGIILLIILFISNLIYKKRYT